MKKSGSEKHQGGYNVSKPKVTSKGMNPTSFARNNLAKDGVNQMLGGRWASQVKGK